ncbi:helix-turn-helix transcriptional regulator [Streptacidiphilus carbonis]|uniref:helix-turn-helix transcriptional regulator n=1 Tax=Streptacidiphilus carbonis TaxID=105422 RepID=UPI0005A693DB|nr:hypothetical protein [Streptacidiphilus carbonis]
MPVMLPLANGISTDHPVPGIPFVDDSHIPTADRYELEKVGRRGGDGMWGREDDSPEGSWIAVTTDPVRHDLAWCVKWHPDHGRSVLLVRDDDASPRHIQWWNTALLFRQGGYWWDGDRWFRPDQVFDQEAEEFDHRPVVGAVTVTADQLLDGSGDPQGGRLLRVADFDLDAAAPTVWLDHLALWATRRGASGADALPLERCVVKLSAPELAGDQLIGLPELAGMAGIAASTLRAYIARHEGEVPLPQAVLSGRSAWAKPVARDWVERRNQARESDAGTASTSRGQALRVGSHDLRDRLARRFFRELWDHPGVRRHWALRFRTPESVLKVAQGLGQQVADRLDDIVPMADLAGTFELAMKHELGACPAGASDSDLGPGLSPPVARMLEWLVQHDPKRAQGTVERLVGYAEKELGMPPASVIGLLRLALAQDTRSSSDCHGFLDQIPVAYEQAAD